MPPTKEQLRLQMREQRRCLSAEQLGIAADKAAQLFAASPLFSSSQRIAFYIAHQGELDPQPLLDMAHAAGKRCYLPVLHTNKMGHLEFVAYAPGDSLKKNRYGIPEPTQTTANTIDPHQLDVVVAPLVAFDAKGDRLGMGAGYYDKTFEYLRLETDSTTQLIGYAHAFQQVDTIDAESWDVPVDAIVTDEKIIWSTR